MAKAEQYQMGFDFGRPDSVFEYDLASEWHDEDGQLLGVNRFTRTLREPVCVKTPNEVAFHLMSQIYTPFESFTQEELWSLLLNTKNHITHEVMVYRGTVDSVHIRIAEILREPIRFNSRRLILSHCHPSGSPEPSPEDIKFNAECLQAAALLGIDLIDHIVVGNNEWVSLRARGFWSSELGRHSNEEGR